MGQQQTHRGKNPEDTALFAPKWIPLLRRAVEEFSYLLTRGYADDPALKLVGDHRQLHARQRRGVKRAACSDGSLERRKAHEAPLETLAGQAVAIDGYNLLITVESALSHGILLRGRDGHVRDMASIHGSYRRVEETLPAIRLIGELLADAGVLAVRWYFDAPVSNSGMLRRLLLDEAAERRWAWTVELETNPDKLLAACTDPVISGDSWILDRAERWVNFTDAVIEHLQMDSEVADLRTP